MDYQVELSRLARQDLRDIVRYISVDAPDRARLSLAGFLSRAPKRSLNFQSLAEPCQSLTISLFVKLLSAPIGSSTGLTISAVQWRWFAFGMEPEERQTSEVNGTSPNSVRAERIAEGVW